MLDLPWTTETDLPYGEQPRIYDATGALVAVVGNAEVEKQDDWEMNAAAIVSAVNGNSVVAENATCKRPLQVDQLVRRLRWRSSLRGDYGQHEAALDAEAASLITSLAARVEALEAVLEPFAAVAEHDIGDDETDDDIFWPISNARYSMSGRLRVGHLRAARRAREAQGGE